MEFCSCKNSCAYALQLYLRHTKKLNVRACYNTAFAFSFCAKMIQNNSHGLCVECKEWIYNPICAKCLAEQLNSWFNESGINGIARKKIRNFILTIDKKEPPFQDIKCAVCKNNETNICPYCFTEYAYNLLKRLKVNKKLIREFFTYFNYDFERTGYGKDFEEDLK